MSGQYVKPSFGLLDFGLRDTGMNSLRIVEDVLEYAKMADQLGFKRIWLSEHHIPDPLAGWYDPLPLLPLIAGMTERIVTGIAGAQLSIQNPYRVALNYKLLANLFPDRIDLGLASGGPPDNIMFYFGDEKVGLAEKQATLFGLLNDEERLAREREVIIPPYKGAVPRVWILSSSYNRLDEAIRQRACFSRSLFHGGDLGFYRERLEEFKEKYFEQHGERPLLTLAFSGCCHETDQRARRIAERANYRGIASVNICGSVGRFKDVILSYQEQYGYDEFTFLNIARSPEDRKASLVLLQKAFDL